MMLVTAFTALFLPVGMLFLALGLAGIHDAAALLSRGVETTGEVIGLSTERGKGGPAYIVQYRYQVQEPDVRRFTGSRAVSLNEYLQLRPGAEIPVLYDPSVPYHSVASINNSFRDGRAYVGADVVLGGALVMLAIWAMLVGLLLRRYRADRRLLARGLAAEAKNLFEEKGRRGTRIVNYEFRDASGEVVLGSQSDIPAADDKRPMHRDYRSQVFANPTALYDPEDPRRSMLYPPPSAVLR